MVIVIVLFLRLMTVAIIALVLRLGVGLFHRLRLLPNAAALRFPAIHVLVIHRVIAESHLLRIPALLQVQANRSGRGGWLLRFTGDRR